jgi:hypothetical protein
MYVIIGRHFVPFGCKFLLISLVIVRITLNVIVRQMPLKCPLHNGMSIFQKLVVRLSNTSTMISQQVEITLSKCLRV